MGRHHTRKYFDHLGTVQEHRRSRAVSASTLAESIPQRADTSTVDRASRNNRADNNKLAVLHSSTAVKQLRMLRLQ